ncbi:MAG: hypothetical protein E4H36_12305 [Spirochaetales bacterium]|nr:MAG: hypothetical protein E4H36_12305 [Spirochaetales bacterium]
MGLFQRLAELFSGGNESERKKKRLLKDIGKQLSKQKNKFYKPQGKEVLPGLAKFFYNMYRIVSSAQILLENAKSSGVLKVIIIESFLSDEQKELLAEFSEESIQQRAEKEDVKELSSALKEHIITFFSYFNTERITKINGTYRLFHVFMQILNFDYYFMLKKFDSNMPERNFTGYTPSFDVINAKYILDDMKDFLEILPLLETDADWDGLFDILKSFKSAEIISRNDWKKLLRVLINLRNSENLLLTVRHLTDDPYYKTASHPSKENIVEDYLQKIKTQTELAIQKISQSRRTSKIDSLAKILFGTDAAQRMQNYTDKGNILFSKKMLSGYTYIAPVNYLKAFLLDYAKGGIKEIVDLFVIKAQWAVDIDSTQLSEAYHQLLRISDDLKILDDSLAEEAETGIKLKTLVIKSDKDPNSFSVLKKLIGEINDKALRLVRDSGQILVGLAKNIKSLLDEYNRHGKETVVNWKELETAADNKISEKLSAVYKKIYYFIQLIQLFLK